jgi:hypothetical protein
VTRLQWLKDGLVIPNSNKTTLSFNVIDANDSSEYTLSAFSATGRADLVFRIDVNPDINQVVCPTKRFRDIPFDWFRGIRSRWVTSGLPDDLGKRFSIVPDLGGQSLEMWMRAIENTGANIAEINLDPSNHLIDLNNNPKGRIPLSDDEWRLYTSAYYEQHFSSCTAENTTTCLSQEESAILIKAREKISNYDYTVEQRNSQLVDFFNRLNQLKRACRINGHVQFIIHQRLWFRQKDAQAPYGISAKNFDQERAKTISTFVGDFSRFINDAKRAQVSNWLIGIRLGEHANKDMRDYLPLLVDLATQINVNTADWLK